MKEKLPSYLLEFPTEDFRRQLKQASIISGEKSMKSFILKAIEMRIDMTFGNDNDKIGGNK